jgi:hypothetical protein
MKFVFRSAIALLTFLIGVATTVCLLPLAVYSSLLLLFLIPLTIAGIVVYQGAYLKKAWRPALGKGFLALLLWYFPSHFPAFVSLLI